MNGIFLTWPWWIAGPLIGLTVPLLFLLAGKFFGISTSLQQIGAMCTPAAGPDYLTQFNWRKGIWLIVFVAGIGLGGFLASRFLTLEPISMLPETYMGWQGGIMLLAGGILVGFGARYAGGCTSGHSITGIANLNWPSLLATIFFFVGGLTITWIFFRT